MGKTPHRRMKQSEQVQDHAGWMSGFISFFDFRRGGSNHRLLSEKRTGSKASQGFSQDMTGSVDSKYQFVYDAYDSPKPMLGTGKQSDKNFFEEVMVMDNNTQNRNDSFLEFVDFANDADINTLVREILIRIQKKRSGGEEQGHSGNFSILPEKIRAKFVNQLTDATKVILYEKLIGRMPVGLDGKTKYSREFIGALEILISHKDVFFKLLEDPNSELTRRIDNLINSELGKCADQKESEGLHHYNLGLFSKRRVTSQEFSLSSTDESSEVSRSSAILSHESETSSVLYTVNSSELGSKRKSSFFFTEIKRRLKRVMGKDKEEVFTNIEKARSISRRYSFERMSPSRNPHLEVEIHPKRLSNSKWSDFECTESTDMALEKENMRPSEKNSSSSHVERKKHNFIDMLTDDIFYEKLSKGRDLEFARKSFSVFDRTYFPSYPTRQASLPTISLRKTLSSNDNSKVPELENNINAAVDLSDNSVVAASCESDDKCCVNESLGHSPIISENVVFGDGEDEEKVSSELNSADITDADIEKQDAVVEERTTPSEITSADSGSDKTEQFDNVPSRIDNQPSPTSVLESAYSEGGVSPPRTKKLQDELTPVAPLQNHSEEGEESLEFDSNKSLSVKKYCDDKESKLKNYIRKILTASDFSWDTLYVRYLSLDQLLDISLYNNEEDQPSSKDMLLLDLLNEVLFNSCTRYFGYSPWVSVPNPNIRPFSEAESTFEEIVEEMESRLEPSAHHQDVEQILAKEIYKDMSCTDFRDDIETIGIEIADLILQKLITDTLPSCFSFTEKPRLVHLFST